MVAEVGLGTNGRRGHPLFTFCHLRRHGTVAKVGGPAGFRSLRAGLLLDQSSRRHPGTAECCNLVRAIADNCVLSQKWCCHACWSCVVSEGIS